MTKGDKAGLHPGIVRIDAVHMGEMTRGRGEYERAFLSMARSPKGDVTRFPGLGPSR